MRGLCTDALQATHWAYDNLFVSCMKTHEMVAVQVIPCFSKPA